jgi:predicted nucleic acid-binding protein
MAATLNRKWALDTNILLDLAAGLEAAETLREIASERGYSLHVSRRVLVELADLVLNGSNPKLRATARTALEDLVAWSISELPRTPSASEVAAQFSAIAREQGLLPEAELNDGIILAEASLGGAALLISSDAHIHSIDPDALRLLFESRDMNPIPTISPRKLCSLFGSQSKTAARYQRFIFARPETPTNPRPLLPTSFQANLPA